MATNRVGSITEDPAYQNGPTVLQIERRPSLSYEDFHKEYVLPNKPVIIPNFGQTYENFDLLRSHKWWQENYGTHKIHVRRGERLKREYGTRILSELFDDLQDDVIHQHDIRIFEGIDRFYTPPKYIPNTRWVNSNLWYGPTGNITPCHHDNHSEDDTGEGEGSNNNLFLVLDGLKKWVIAAPTQNASFYQRSKAEYPKDFHYSMVDIDNPDYEKYPLFKQATLYECNLASGELLYVPRAYWHFVRNLKPTLGISAWWLKQDNKVSRYNII